MQSTFLKVTSIGNAGDTAYRIEAIMQLQGSRPLVVYWNEKPEANIQREERTIMAICPTMDGVEWSSLTINNEQVGEITTTHESLFSKVYLPTDLLSFLICHPLRIY